jgi:hypothetical protein
VICRCGRADNPLDVYDDWMVRVAPALVVVFSATAACQADGGAHSGAGGERATGGASTTTASGGVAGSGGTTVGGSGASGIPGSSGGAIGSGGAAGSGSVPVANCPDIGLDAATVHYICDCQAGAAPGCVAGDDTGAGDVAAPWRTVTKAQQAFASAQAGTTFAFCRGGAFAPGSSGAWVNDGTKTGCTAANPCVVRDYVPPGAAGAPPRPIITVSSGHGVDLANGGNAEHQEGYVFLNLDLRSTAIGTSGNGFFIYNDVDDVLVCGVAIDGFQVGFYMAGSNPAAAGSDGKNVRIELRSSSITNCGSQGMLGSCDDCVVAYNRFANNGFTATTSSEGARNHNIYLSAHSLVHRMKVVGNDLYQSAMVGGSCTGTPLVVHGMFQDLLIEGNSIHEDLGAAGGGCWGLAVDTGYSGEHEEFTDVVIRRNTVVNVGNVSIGTTGCHNCLIENNLVIQQQTGFGGALVSVPNRTGGSEDQATDAVTVRNNTLIDLSSASYTGLHLGVEGTGHVATNNAVWGGAGGTLTCFDYDLADASYASRDYNLCFAASGTLRWATGQPALAGFQMATGADAHSLTADPLFVSSQAPFDFHPGAGSPLVDAALAQAPADDLSGAIRGPLPDIGALER